MPRLLQEEFNNPYNQYAVSKLAEEKTALWLGWLHGIPTVALRYSITQGKRQSLYNNYSGVCRIFFTRALRKEPLIIYEDGWQTRDFVHVKDVVEANMLVLKNDDANFRAFNVGSGQSTTVAAYAKAVLNKLAISVDLQFTGEYRLGDNRHSVSSVGNLKLLGWTPKNDLCQILDDFGEWISSLGGLPKEIPDAYAHMQNMGVVRRAMVPS
jgi:dTDP-L-rhamnose 4-epimerase